MDKQTRSGNRQKYRWMDRHETERCLTDKKITSQLVRQTGRQAGRKQTGRQQTDRHTDRPHTQDKTVNAI
jgi:hypothetical protein